ncbi:MAG TPA: GNAT family protein [Telluria sp.]
MPHPEFEITRGVFLSPIALSDTTALACLVQENIDHLKAFMPALVQLASVDRAAVHLDRGMQAAADGDMLEWHIFENRILCGSVRLKDIDSSTRSASIGYFVGERFQGKGLVTRSVHAVIDYCFDQLGLNRIELRCAASNSASIRMAIRLGFSLEGVLRQAEYLDGVFVDLHVFGLLAPR